MDLYKFHKTPKILHGHHEADDVVPSRILNSMDNDRPLNKKQIETLLKHPNTAYRYARHLGKRFPEGEDIISKDPKYAYWYASQVLEEPWLKGEEAILKDPFYASYYARDILNKRWPKAEDIIAKEADAAYIYAKYVIKGPWPKGENAIATNVDYALPYAKIVLKKRFLKAEDTIKYSKYRVEYERHFGIKL
jgi:lambda repressor-like predicted transcriptional regulator